MKNSRGLSENLRFVLLFLELTALRQFQNIRYLFWFYRFEKVYFLYRISLEMTDFFTELLLYNCKIGKNHE